jgi:hypothetical protein
MVTSSTFGAGGLAGGAVVQASVMAKGRWLMAMVHGPTIRHLPSAVSHKPWRDRIVNGILKRL